MDLKASRSTIWLTPRNDSSSYLEPASIYTPTPEKGPGKDSVATRMPFDNSVTLSSSTGSYFPRWLDEARGLVQYRDSLGAKDLWRWNNSLVVISKALPLISHCEAPSQRQCAFWL